MRENMGIYRGKALKWNRWVEGYFLKHYNDYGIVAIGPDGKDQAWVSVDPATVGQFTGLVDKNGVKVFEGDVLRPSYGQIFIVEWDGENGRFLGFTIGNDRRIAYVGREPKAEVVGNIHDNCEMLEISKNPAK